MFLRISKNLTQCLKKQKPKAERPFDVAQSPRAAIGRPRNPRQVRQERWNRRHRGFNRNGKEPHQIAGRVNFYLFLPN